MNASSFIKVDKATFFKIAAAHSDERLEYVRGRIMQQMTGATRRHSPVADRIARLLEDRIGPGLVVVRERGIDTPETVRYADVVVEPVNGSEGSLATKRAVIIVEVLSPTPGERDIGIKSVEYGTFESVVTYIVAGQDEAACLVWTRDNSQHFSSEPTDVIGFSSSIDIPGLSLTLPRGEIYRGIVAAPETKD